MNWNIGSMSGKKVVIALGRKRIYVCCVHERRWNGERTEMFGGGEIDLILSYRDVMMLMLGVGVFVME